MVDGICEFSTIGPPIQNIPVTYDDGSAGPMPRTDYYVDAGIPVGGDGLSWGTAFKTITAATNAVLNRGDHVTIKPGTYNEAVVIKSNGLELLPLKTGITLTDSNTVIFPAGISLDCIDPASYPDEIFLYLYRSMKGNSGVYEVLDMNPATRMVTLKGADFTAEAGVVGDTSKVQASIAHAIVYRKDTTLAAPVTINAGGVANARAVCYIGTPADASGETVSTSASYNILDGLDLTGMNSTGARGYGLRIQGSNYNVFMQGKIYECDSVGILIHGISTFPAKRNIILENTMYNISRKGLKLGKEGQTASNNMVHHNLFIGNEVYSTGLGLNKGFYTMAETQQYTSHNLISDNTFRSFSFIQPNRGAIQIGSYSTDNVVEGNFLRDITDNLTTSNAFIYIRNNASRAKVFNNVLLMSAVTDDNIFAFRLNAAGHTGSRAVFNTVFRVDKGVLFEDSGGTAPDFSFQNNILNSIADVYFTHTVTGGRYTVGYNNYGIIPTQSGGMYYNIDPTSIIADPLFFDPAFYGSAYGLTLQSGSPCLLSGTPVTDLTTDYFDTARDATHPAIGAFEELLTGTSWTGQISNDWHDYRNWNPEIVPGATLDVFIPNKENDPIIFNNNASCKSIDIQPHVEVNVNTSRTLTILN